MGRAGHSIRRAGSIARSLADLALAQAQDSQGQFQQARALRLDALAVARRHVDAEALFSSAVYLLRYGAPKYWEQRVRLAEECADWPRQGASSLTLADARTGQVLTIEAPTPHDGRP